ncbi:hypothetical protein N7508_000427, partial [Penicillium antarcticum]|uniref:uncharacterized protein n=1 Tax=Penicillium antarcticum TaxID=416450 RepID=UPI00239A010A
WHLLPWGDYTPFNDDDTYRPKLPDLWEGTTSCAPSPGYLDREWTLSVICPSPDLEDIVAEWSPSLYQHPSDRLSCDHMIKEDASNILRRKIARGRRVRLDNTDIVLLVNSYRSIDKHFEVTSVDWTVAEK